MRFYSFLLLICFSKAVFSSSSISYSEINYVPQDTIAFQQKIDSADFYLHADINKATRFYKEALDIVSPNQELLIATVYGRLGTVERMKSNYVKALDFQLKSLKIHEKYHDSLKISENYHNLGVLMRFQKENGDSEKYFNKAIALGEQLNDTIGLGGSYSMLGVIYRRQKKYKQAEQQYMKAIELFMLVDDKEEVLHVNGNLASLYYAQKQYEKSNTINLRDLEYLKKNNEKSSLATRYSNIARGYEKLKKHKIAIVYFDSVIALSKEQGYLRQLSNNYNGRSKNYYLLNDYKNALNDYRAYKRTNDSVFNLKNTKEITTMLLSAKFEKQQAIDSIRFSEKEKQLELIATSEKSKKKFYSLVLFVSVIVGFMVFYNLKQKRKIISKKLENEGLQAKLIQQKLEITESETQRIINEKAISLSYKQNMVSRIKEFVKKEEVNSVFRDLKILVIELEHQIKAETSQSVLDENLENLHVKFEKKLIQNYPTLTKTEREICSLILANKSIKDIVTLKGVSSASVQSIRYRIRKKLNLEKGDELQQFLKGLS